LSLAVVRDLRDLRAPATPDELADFETDVLAGFVLARASAGLADGTISGDVNHLEQVRAWFGKPLWDMEPADADAYFGQVLRAAAKGTRLGRAQALTTFFAFLELRHKVEIHAMTGRFVECPIDEMNKPRGRKQAALRIPPIEDVWGHFDDDHRRPGAPLFPSERKNTDGTCRRVGDDALRAGLAGAACTHLPGWADTLSPHVLRHFAASQLYLSGVDLIAIQELLGHSWISSTLNYVHVHRTRIEDAWVAGQQRAANRLEGLLS